MKKLRQELVLITGMSGSGKSVALHALEDAGYLCVDNLPPELLRSFVQLEQKRKEKRIAIAMDVRSAASLPLLPQELDLVRQKDVDVRMLFWMPAPTPWFSATQKPAAVIRCRATMPSAWTPILSAT